jgi:predicted ATPase
MKMIESTGERCVEAETHRTRGSLLLSINEHGAAEESFRRSLQISQEQSARFWRLRAAVSLARLWRDQGRREEAKDLLVPIYGWFREGVDTPVLHDAKALRDAHATVMPGVMRVCDPLAADRATVLPAFSWFGS